MAPNKTQTPPIKNVQVLTSYYANGQLYAVVEKDDTVRFYKLMNTASTDSYPIWIPTDIYLKGHIAVIGLEE